MIAAAESHSGRPKGTIAFSPNAVGLTLRVVRRGA